MPTRPITGPFANSPSGGVTGVVVGVASLITAIPATVTNGSNAWLSRNAATGLLYGVSAANGHYITSPDGVTVTDRVETLSVKTPNTIGFEFDATYMYAYATDGKIYRAALNDFATWTDVSVPTRGPLTSARPGVLLALGGGVLLYGNYTSGGGDGAHIWRSTNSGGTWTEVLAYASGKHVHAIRKSPATGVVWASIGDAGWDGTGLHKSTDSGATWSLMSSNRYGIDMVFTQIGGANWIVLEGDGLNEPHLVGFPENGAQGDPTIPLVNYVGEDNAPGSTRGTARGIGLCPTGDVIYFTTTEGGAVGDNAGIYVARSPGLTTSRLLKSTTGAEPVYYTPSFVIGGIVYNYRWSFPMPQFSTVARENLLTNSTLVGGGAAPTGWARPGGTGTSAPAASTLGADAIAYDQSATAQRPFLQASSDPTLLANSAYSFSVQVESITGSVACNNVLCIVSAPAGSTVQYYLDDVPKASTDLAASGRLRAVIRTAATGGAVQLRVGLGGTSSVASASLRFSRPQLEARDFSGPFKAT